MEATPPTQERTLPPARTVRIRRGYEHTAWRWMRYSAIALIPLVWIHVLIQDVLVGVHRIDLTYVQQRWATWGWSIFDILLLGFAFAHGMNGLRQVLDDFIHSPRARAVLGWVIFFAWLIITIIGAVAIIAVFAQRMPA